MPDNEEHAIGSVSAVPSNFQGFITRSDGYCFIRLHRDSVDHKFFFNCNVLGMGEEVFFRVLNDECPYPPVSPPSPPAEEVCYLYAKKAAETINSVVKYVGKESAEKFAACLITVVTTTTPGNLESLCSRKALEGEWMAVT